METLQTNLFTEKLIALLRKGDTKQNRNHFILTIHENKIRQLVAGDEFFGEVAKEKQADLKKLAAEAKRVVEEKRAADKEAAEKAETKRQEQIKKSREAAAAAALAKEVALEEKRKKVRQAHQAARDAGKNFEEAEKIAAASVIEPEGDK